MTSDSSFSYPQNVKTHHLYTFYASSCAARVMIACHLKKIPLTYHYIDMSKSEHNESTYKAINPNGTIPTLVIEFSDGTTKRLTQSLAILSYFEEQFPDRCPLLGDPRDPDPWRRAVIREMQNVVTNDIFPPTNAKIAGKVKAVRGSRDDATAFVHAVMNDGFAAYEALTAEHGGEYSFGDRVTVADVCLVPQVDQALFWKLDFERFPRTKAVYDRLMMLDDFKRGTWRYQEDTPEKDRLVV